MICATRRSSDDDNIGIDLEDEESKERTLEVLDAGTKKDKKDSLPAKIDGGKQSKELDIPYIEAPKNIEELYSLLDNCSTSDTILLSITFGPENHKKMQV
ncbi:uncharacterized protein DS421_4g108750 [Arachis hypogaea]|nr:uncharacterized protein DS421_4g108750 [Arachis hypogaea]